MFEKLLLAAIITFSLYFNSKIEWSRPMNPLQLQVQAPQAQLLKILMFQNFNVQ
ncbi:hypothetical protein VB834_10380 [Limnoraphis robusta Tam1]|uniref:Uncharacterized protein n=1 Tax=Limnoraphis robusta CCNP1315 TaxID=3110306 RepID=A0ABU5TVR5_9CYAN|nr:hypothetical protein [Limnoraphis robusta]MEA5498958.1 hypothetical protein [Limnoraphis robusta BA-68 BA1]MEA5518993.1 hypothetical protein [Limnoraphis robusta CCNP1315]MEA5539440.1 hypothetical protein [Limnoraphis robusta Tam1]MEA5544035.1 hypothetical protein [Limnoraphis robusta CCNP1324]